MRRAPGDGTCCGVQMEWLCEGCPYRLRGEVLIPADPPKTETDQAVEDDINENADYLR